MRPYRRPALAWFWINWDRHRNLSPCRADLSRQIEYPGAQVFVIVDAMPSAVAAHNSAVRRTHPELILDQQEIGVNG